MSQVKKESRKSIRGVQHEVHQLLLSFFHASAVPQHLLELHNALIQRQVLSDFRMNLLDRRVLGRPQDVLHLHRFDDTDLLPGYHTFALCADESVKGVT